MLLGASASSAAQVVAPPVTEYEERAAGTFELTNNSLVPATVVIEAFGFRVDTLGRVSYIPFDTSVVRLKLSTTTVRVPPRSSFNVSYEASATSTPTWFVLASSFSGPRTEGLNVRLQLPHVVYLNQRQPIERSAVRVHAVVVDTAAKKARVKIENTSDRLGRVLLSSLRGPQGTTQGGAFPLFPTFWRWVEFDWDGATPPESVRLEFERFTLEVQTRDLGAVAAAP